ncbi:MAG TPA: GNAT family protein [Candidatus Binatia bacterium]|jgi:RimJ/RimL family protein N-acetyltransferase|nr:GNAT family protein [Candidatus Binatia bacterium]
MQHNIQEEGFGVRLRPVRMEDASFIVWLRNLGHVKGNVGDSAMDVASQQRWLENYFQRDGDYYFVIETAGAKAVGAYGIYDVSGGTAESGRWIIRPEVPAAIPSALLAFKLGFERLGLKGLRAKTVTTNHGVLSLNKKFGFRETGVERGALMIGGNRVDLICFLLEAKDWPKIRETLLPLAQVAERQVRDWDQAQPQ